MFINNLIDVNIARFVKTPKLSRYLPHYLSLKEAKDILQLPTGKDLKALRERLILELFYATGIRIAELINIQMNDIRLEEGIINVLGKGSKERIVIIGSEAKEALYNYIELMSKKTNFENKQFLFPSLRTGKNKQIGSISTRTVFNIVKKYLKQVSNNETRYYFAIMIFELKIITYINPK